MKLMHLSDLHLGRLLYRYSLEEEQAEMLERIRQIAQDEEPDAVLIAGDVYDRGVPPLYAVSLLDDFLQRLLAMDLPVFLISGNHDSAQRLGFLSGALESSGLHISPVYRGAVTPVTLCDADGPVDIWMLPYVKAATVRPWFPEESIENTHDAVACAVRHMAIDPARRNVLLAHQFVAGAKRSGSEESLEFTQDVIVGGSDMVDAGMFDSFDYVALGHLHQAQNVGSERIRYCGTPIAYSYSEMRTEKSVTMIDLRADRSLTLRTIPLPAPRRLQEVRGTFAEVTDESYLRTVDRDAYTHVILTDDAPVPDVLARLRQAYPRMTHLDWDNARTRHQEDWSAVEADEKRTPISLFGEFFRQMGGADLSPEQDAYMAQIIREIWEEKA